MSKGAQEEWEELRHNKGWMELKEGEGLKEREWMELQHENRKLRDRLEIFTRRLESLVAEMKTEVLDSCTSIPG